MTGKTNEFVAPVWWRTSTAGLIESVQVVSLTAGESGDLLLFAREPNADIEYFPFAPGAGPPHESAPPPEHLRFRESRRFAVKIRYGYGGRQVATIHVGVKLPLRGGVEFESPGGGSWSA